VVRHWCLRTRVGAQMPQCLCLVPLKVQSIHCMTHRFTFHSSPFGCQIQMQMAYAQTEAPTPIPYWPITTDTFGRPNIAATLVSAMNHNHQCSSQFGHASCVIQMKRTEMHGARARLHFLCADSLDTSDLLATRSLARCLPRRARVHAEQTSNN
jgi:hypothetical protein